jgi:hypothetical protein
MTSALRSLANTEFWSTPISKSRPVSDLKRVTRVGLKCKAAASSLYSDRLPCLLGLARVDCSLFHPDPRPVCAFGFPITRSPDPSLIHAHPQFSIRFTTDQQLTCDHPPLLRFLRSSAFQRFWLSDHQITRSFPDQRSSAVRFCFLAILPLLAIRSQTTSSRLSASDLSSHPSCIGGEL